MRTGRGWAALGVVAAGCFALVAWPAPALRLWWGGVVPALPAILMVSPRLWRNVCPVAALEVAAGRAGRSLDAVASIRTGALGALGFTVVVATRPALLDRSGPALAALLAGALVLALVRGRGHAVRAGFCNALCPLGPVERFYGQRALLDVEPVHCASCARCTARGCPDVAGDKALRQLVGGTGRVGWLLRPQGALAGAMPGMTVGYAWAAGSGSWCLGGVGVLGGGALSWGVVWALSVLVPEGGRRLPPLTAGLTALLFYQLVAPVSVGVWGSPVLTSAIRWLGTGLVVVWTMRPRRASARPAGRRPADPRRRSLPVLSMPTG